MAYRGEDLDLQTPQTWVGAPPDLGVAGDLSQAQNGKRGLYRNGPILVDDTLLACCNQAYEVAVANRAVEVRVEHLLHAMTRVDQAFGVLEARGIRAAGLRRETATLVGSEIPAATSNGTQPRRSDELADLLRLAANLAARRNAPAGTDDVIIVLLDHRADFPAADLLARFASRPYALREVPEPLPPLTRPSFDQRYASGYGQRYLPEPPRSYRADLTGTPTDALQNSRIEALEQMLRALGQDFSNERHIVSGLVRDLSRDTQAHQDDQSRRQSTLLDRIGTLEDTMLQSRATPAHDGNLVSKLESIEAALELRLQEMSQSWAVLSKRLQELETAVRGQVVSGASADEIRQAIDLRPIANRLDIIEEAVLSRDSSGDKGLHERFSRLEAEIGRALAVAGADGRLDTLVSGFDRVGGVAEKLDAQHAYVTQTASGVAQRLAAVEQAITAEIETAAAKHQAYTKDLREVHDALMKLNQNQHTLAGSMDQWRSDSGTDMANIATRLSSLDRDNTRPMESLNALNAHMDTMNRLLIERYHRRNRFWYWLFGTDDWIGSSWPSQKAAVDAEKERLRSAAY